MSDYTQIVSFGPKDSLITGDPNKLVRGTEIDAELAAIQTANNSKLDETTFASNAEVLALVSATTVVSPLRLGEALVQAAGAGLTNTAGVLAVVSANVGIVVNADDITLAQAIEGAIGGAAVATQVQTDAGTDDTTMVTPLKLTNFSGLGGGSSNVQTKYMTANQDVTNSAALVNATDLAGFVLAADRRYAVEGFLVFNATVDTVDCKFDLNPNNAIGDSKLSAWANNADGTQEYSAAINDIAGDRPFAINNPSPLAIEFKGHFDSSVATVLDLRFAQQTAAAAETTTLQIGSWIRLTDLGPA